MTQPYYGCSVKMTLAITGVGWTQCYTATVGCRVKIEWHLLEAISHVDFNDNIKKTHAGVGGFVPCACIGNPLRGVFSSGTLRERTRKSQINRGPSSAQSAVMCGLLFFLMHSVHAMTSKVSDEYCEYASHRCPDSRHMWPAVLVHEVPTWITYFFISLRPFQPHSRTHSHWHFALMCAMRSIAHSLCGVGPRVFHSEKVA